MVRAYVHDGLTTVKTLDCARVCPPPVHPTAHTYLARFFCTVPDPFPLPGGFGDSLSQSGVRLGSVSVSAVHVSALRKLVTSARATVGAVRAACAMLRVFNLPRDLSV